MESFQKRTPVTVPAVEAENWTPSSTEFISVAVSLSGTAVFPNKLERAVTLMLIPRGVSVLRLSSIARDMIVCVPAVAFQLYVQLVVPEARNQVVTGRTQDHKEAVRAFVEKRAPVFAGH